MGGGGEEEPGRPVPATAALMSPSDAPDGKTTAACVSASVQKSLVKQSRVR